MVHAATDRQLWAENVVRDPRDIVRLQGEVWRAIADAIQVALGPADRSRLPRGRLADQ